ncbi:proton-conducting transporter transmembrane domain-containing protein [[Muricauda] lutisoli]|uniref:Pesticidal protein Cry28Aa n=1 Tax=[Muricauda] lutisoli TaxID=2816035 RepID=A0ABS3ESC4_9FLAO|nr:proton-conducting transporter membrane subunit [[Muricauda] lutisoli]MBO0329094.1 pesticidal protein Cry28Aa [[Muricauda] lutisoli]
MTLLTRTIRNSSKKIDITGIIPVLFWTIFLTNLIFTVLYYPNIPDWRWDNLFRINGFSALLWTTVTFFSAIIGSYANSYFKDKDQKSKFMLLSLGFTLGVMLFVISEHLVLLLLSWLLMGTIMSALIGLDSKWGDAREAKRFTRQYFIISTIFLSIGLLLPASYNNTITLSEWVASIAQTPSYIKIISALCIIMAALVQSAIFPFHKWLLSAMTAPTPASALMHAGFVNGSGILLTLFAPLLFASNTLEILLIVGGLTAILAQFTKLIQVNVKQRLACSTIAQMGFMIMQCGLGFFNAAIAHLILHGFYKAYLFLSSGEEIEQSTPTEPPVIRIKWLQALVVLLFSLLGAYLFVLLTGKGMHMDSGIFLTLIVSTTVGQATYNIVKQNPLSGIQRIVLPPVLFISGIGVYSLFYNGVTALLADMPFVVSPIQLSTTQIVFGIVFLVGFFLMKLGIYRRIPWLYVKLLNLSQPKNRTILMYKSKFQ